ncbi:MAG: aquaporin family protein [Candidatus Obscuribacterales bacterium]|nr:aquaporin family protein [Candidatus Obscuribacterales bacterium]
MLLKCLVSEFFGTAFLLATVVGSGALMHKLDAGNVAVTVFGVSVATGLVLLASINTLGSISAQFNPIVALLNVVQGKMKWSLLVPYVVAQILGAIAGVVVANLMFEVPAFAISTDPRTGYGQWIGEMVATFGLVGLIVGCSRTKPDSVGATVSAYVASAIMFTSSTCFANPAVSISRMFTTTITGIRPVDVPAFIAFELIGAVLGFVVFSWLVGKESSSLPHQSDSIRVADDSRRVEREVVAASRG